MIFLYIILSATCLAVAFLVFQLATLKRSIKNTFEQIVQKVQTITEEQHAISQHVAEEVPLDLQKELSEKIEHLKQDIKTLATNMIVREQFESEIEKIGNSIAIISEELLGVKHQSEHAYQRLEKLKQL